MYPMAYDNFYNVKGSRRRKKKNYIKTVFSSLVFISLILLIPGKSVISMGYKFGASDSTRAVISLKGEEEQKTLYELDLIPDFVSDEYLVKAGLLYDVESRKIIWEKKMNSAFPIASLTKMMVALIAMEDIKDAKTTWETNVKVTKEACLIRGSKINLRRGETLTVLDLMKSSLIASSNDAAYQLAQHLGGTAANFVDRMNSRAKSLGMTSTFFYNPTGMPSPSKITDNRASPVDLLVLSAELLKYPEITDISSCVDGESVQHGIRTSSLRNHNRLVCTYKDEVNGLKTGFTNNAGFCIVATSNRQNHRMISIVLGVKKSFVRNTVVANMLNDYYSLIGLGKMGEVTDAGSTLVQNEETDEE